MNDQLELFERNEISRLAHLIPYWRDQLEKGIKDAYAFRHDRDLTGWSWGVGAASFAEHLHAEGAISDEALKRYQRFFDRCERLEAADYETE